MRLNRQFPRNWAPRVRCAICGKMVNRVDVEFAFDVDAFYITARCHGAKDVMRLTACDIENMTPGEVAQIMGQVGVAFSKSEQLTPA